MSNILALEANNVGRILDLISSLLLVLGLLLVGDEVKSNFVLRVLLHTQDITTTFTTKKIHFHDDTCLSQ